MEYKIKTYPLLHIACEASSPIITEYLFAKGAELDKRDHDGDTPLKSLFTTVEFTDESLLVLKVLLASNIDLTSVNNQGDNALMRLVALLPSGGPEKVDDDETRIMVAALALLISHVFDTAHCNHSHACVWHYMARFEGAFYKTEIFMSQLSKDIIENSIDIMDKKGRTPLQDVNVSLPGSLWTPDSVAEVSLDLVCRQDIKKYLKAKN